jgi:hypothetical protein
MSSVVASKYEWRRHYAMAALQGMLSDEKTSSGFIASAGEDWNKAKKVLVWTAFQFADEMIAFEEREHEEKVKALRDKETQESKGV